MDNYNKSKWSALNSAALLGLMITTALIIILITEQWPTRIPFFKAIILARTSITYQFADNHALILIDVFVTLWAILLLKSRNKTRKSLISEPNGFFVALLVGLMVPTVHEIEFFVSVVLKYGFNPLDIQGSSLYWMIVRAVVLILYWRLEGIHLKELIFAGAMGLYYAAWFSIGLPVSMLSTGPTANFLSLRVNEIEILSWVYASVVWICLVAFDNGLTKARAREAELGSIGTLKDGV